MATTSLAMDVDPDIGSDLLDVTGTANVDDATIDVMFASPLIVTSATYTLVAATGGVAGAPALTTSGSDVARHKLVARS